MAKLDQEIPVGVEGTVFDLVAKGLGSEANLLREYNVALQKLGENPEDEKLGEEVDRLQSELDRTDRDPGSPDFIGDRSGRTVADETFDTMSGGNKSRAMLAQALVSEPHLLILDEPTNHLDFAGIRWLEEFLRKADFTVLFVSHDRAFLRALSTRILELDRGKLTSWTCGYEKFLIRKAEFLSAEEKNNAVFDKKLAEEEVGYARVSRHEHSGNEGRVRALFKLREERADRRELQGKVNLTATNQGQTSGRKVITVKDLDYAWDKQSIIKDFTATILTGDKIGVVGLNGSGKSTLLQLLLKKLEPSSGSVDHGTKLDVAYFDQLKAHIREDLSVAENVAENGDTVEVNGNKKHILSYLRDFLFMPETARAPAKMLSGGGAGTLVIGQIIYSACQPAGLGRTNQ